MRRLMAPGQRLAAQTGGSGPAAALRPVTSRYRAGRLRQSIMAASGQISAGADASLPAQRPSRPARVSVPGFGRQALPPAGARSPWERTSRRGGIGSPHSMLTIYRRQSVIVLQGEIMNHTHNTHAQHHIASPSSRRRHAWHTAAHHTGRRPQWPGRAGADTSGPRPHLGGQPRHTGGHAATSPRRRSCGRARARRPAGH
jgi:hypothetical protein